MSERLLPSSSDAHGLYMMESSQQTVLLVVDMVGQFLDRTRSRASSTSGTDLPVNRPVIRVPGYRESTGIAPEEHKRSRVRYACAEPISTFYSYRQTGSSSLANNRLKLLSRGACCALRPQILAVSRLVAGRSSVSSSPARATQAYPGR